MPRLLNCPDEILVHIFSFLCLHAGDIDPMHSQTPPGGLWALCLTNKKCYQIALPILAQTVFMEYPTWPSLWRFFMAHPYLKTQVQELRVEEAWAEECQDSKKYLPNTEPLSKEELNALIVDAKSQGIDTRFLVDLSDEDDQKCAFAALAVHWFPNVEILALRPPLVILPDEKLCFSFELIKVYEIKRLSYLREVLVGPPSAFIGSVGNAFAHTDLLIQLLKIPSLRVLRLSCMQFGSQMVEFPSSQHWSDVEELYIYRRETTESLATHEAMELSLLCNAPKKLKVLVIDLKDEFGVQENMELARVVSSHHGSLEELWWNSTCQTWEFVLSRTELSKFNKLRYLYLGLEMPQNIVPPIQLLPPNLEHICFRGIPNANTRYFQAVKRSKPKYLLPFRYAFLY